MLVAPVRVIAFASVVTTRPTCNVAPPIVSVPVPRAVL